jgi:hypothetical protein
MNKINSTISIRCFGLDLGNIFQRNIYERRYNCAQSSLVVVTHPLTNRTQRYEQGLWQSG